MEPTISIYFDNDRTYLALFEPDNKGLSLAYINSTNAPIDFANALEFEDSAGVAQLNELIMEIAGAASKCSVSLPMESVFAHQFPAPIGLSPSETQDLLRLEISQHFPHHDAKEFTSSVFPLYPKLNQTQMMLAIILEKNTLSLLNMIVTQLYSELDRVEVAQLSAHNALAYNYPEFSNQTIAVFGVQGNYMDVSVMKNNQLAYYHLIPLNRGDNVGEKCENEIQKILEEYVPFIDSAFLFGSHLNKIMLDQAINKLSIPVQRINTFRMLTTTLGERERQYCSRIAHILPPCVGAILPSINRSIVL